MNLKRIILTTITLTIITIFTLFASQIDLKTLVYSNTYYYADGDDEPTIPDPLPFPAYTPSGGYNL